MVRASCSVCTFQSASSSEHFDGVVIPKLMPVVAASHESSSSRQQSAATMVQKGLLVVIAVVHRSGGEGAEGTIWGSGAICGSQLGGSQGRHPTHQERPCRHHHRSTISVTLLHHTPVTIPHHSLLSVSKFCIMSSVTFLYHRLLWLSFYCAAKYSTASLM